MAIYSSAQPHVVSLELNGRVAVVDGHQTRPYRRVLHPNSKFLFLVEFCFALLFWFVDERKKEKEGAREEKRVN